MPLTNKVSIRISEEAANNIQAAMTTLKENLPELVSLSTQERIELPKMGDKTVSFVTKALDYARQNPSIVPGYLNMDEFETDVESVRELFSILTPLKQLTEAIDDTSMLAGSEAYAAALVFYNAAKGAIAAGQTNLQGMYNDMSARFPGRPKK